MLQYTSIMVIKSESPENTQPDPKFLEARAREILAQKDAVAADAFLMLNAIELLELPRVLVGKLRSLRVAAVPVIGETRERVQQIFTSSPDRMPPVPPQAPAYRSPHWKNPLWSEVYREPRNRQTRTTVRGK